ncbi:hypothetical protein [Brevundimonas sp. LM2]|nr:hypothetical protein [Brevundimonas sp. LM2]
MGLSLGQALGYASRTLTPGQGATVPRADSTAVRADTTTFTADRTL